ncbi:oocyte-secreted protein 3-like [Dromiciops gliroides]|uniref:oocyte-secreted protein 3-like n=1 Tax=Dromiciops gliroides TaxID=33562 RepID=UPI001CC4D185|nr:oocyte-secreted protein 3-like [Dromiciops gliroides]
MQTKVNWKNKSVEVRSLALGLVTMKTFLALGVLCLLFCLAWVQEKQVDTRCTENVLWVFVKKDLFGDGVLVQAEELKLGTGCPVTTELPDKFELQYLVRYCGIKKMVRDDNVGSHMLNPLHCLSGPVAL